MPPHAPGMSAVHGEAVDLKHGAGDADGAWVSGWMHRVRAPGVAFACVAAITIAASVAASRNVADAEHAVLEARASDATTLVQGGVRQLDIALAAATLAAVPDAIDGGSFRSVLEPRIGTSAPLRSISIVDARTRTVLASAGPESPILSRAATGTWTALARRARLPVAQLLGLSGPPERRIVRVSVAVDGHPGRFIIEEIQVAGAIGTIARSASDVGIAFYLDTSASPISLIGSNTSDLPLKGESVTTPVTIVGSKAFVVVARQGDLLGGVAHALPLLILAIGGLLALLAALVVAHLGRRRHDALELADALRGRHDELTLVSTALAASEAEYRGVFDAATDLIAMLDETGAIEKINPRGLQLLGRDEADVIGCTLVLLAAPGSVDRLQLRLDKLSAGSSPEESTEVELLDVDDRPVALDLRLSARSNGSVQLIGRDVRERRRYEEELERRAFEDPLTGLANRSRLRARVDEALTTATAAALMVVDLDDFKRVNDTLGHGAGDEVLRIAAERIAVCAGADGLCARLGGDEFGIFVPGGPKLATQLAERLLEAFDEPFPLARRSITITPSIGIAGQLGDATTSDLLRDADIAMYRAKVTGKGRFTEFSEEMLAALRDRHELADDLRRAIQNGEIVTAYQPIVEIESRRITAIEALARWDHPTRGRLAPDQFIALAEETGLIVPLGRRVLALALADLASLRELVPDLRVSVNVAARELDEPDFDRSIGESLAAAGLPPDALILELTESALVSSARSFETLDRIGAMGIRLALDDFGSGYSSIDYMRRLPISILKVDRAFMRTDETSGEILDAIVSLAVSLKLETVAEGIETDDHHALARGAHVQRGQGFLYARPTTADEIRTLLADPAAERAAA